jgi:hypothetical protein
VLGSAASGKRVGQPFYLGSASKPEMVSRPSDDVLRLLRVTLQKLGQGLDPLHDAAAMAELKRLILLRIAELKSADSATSPLPKDDAA